MLWMWIGVALLVSMPAAVAVLLALLHVYLCWKYLDKFVRIFPEKPLFIIPRGDPIPGAEDVSFITSDGLALRGCYLRTRQPRKGVILFGLEFGSPRWACKVYCEALLGAGLRRVRLRAPQPG